MKSHAVWFKVLALCSTVALGGGYVWWSQERARERQEKEAARQTQVLPGSKSFVFSGEAGGDGYRRIRVDVGDSEGWKGDGEDERTNADFIGDPVTNKDRTVLPSSKLGVMPPLPREEEEPEKKRTILPSSKSIDRLLVPPDLEDKGKP